jgi:predicted acylesterase/phospholipase RssA
MYSKVIGALSLATLSQAASDKCRVLALGSGDESVAYQVGVIKALVATGDAEYQYDAISGIEAAAVNAVLFGSYAKDDQDAAAARLEKFWIDASNSDLYNQWFGGFIDGMLTKGGFYDSAPLKTFLDSEFADFAGL